MWVKNYTLKTSIARDLTRKGNDAFSVSQKFSISERFAYIECASHLMYHAWFICLSFYLKIFNHEEKVYIWLFLNLFHPTIKTHIIIDLLHNLTSLTINMSNLTLLIWFHFCIYDILNLFHKHGKILNHMNIQDIDSFCITFM